MRTKRCVSVYVEWVDKEDLPSVRRLLEDVGAELYEIDDDVDLEDAPNRDIKRAHTVFRIRFDRNRPSYEILSELITIPSVFSVQQMHL